MVINTNVKNVRKTGEIIIKIILKIIEKMKIIKNHKENIKKQIKVNLQKNDIINLILSIDPLPSINPDLTRACIAHSYYVESHIIELFAPPQETNNQSDIIDTVRIDNSPPCIMKNIIYLLAAPQETSDQKEPEQITKSDRPFACPHPGCNKTFKYYGSISNHRAIHAEKKYKCDTCTYATVRKCSLKQHQKTKRHLKLMKKRAEKAS